MNIKDVLIVDLNSGSYVRDKVGHEIFNFDRNKITGKYYGYVPPYSTVEISNFTAYTKKCEYVENILIVYTTKIEGENNRKIIGFVPNAKVYRKPIIDESLRRVILETNEHVKYAIESHKIIDLRSLDKPFKIVIKDINSSMFRVMRVYGNTYPEFTSSVLEYYETIKNYQNIDEVDDYLFQQDVNNIVVLNKEKNLHKVEPSSILANTTHVKRNANNTKIALNNSNYTCQFNNNHTTFLNGKNIMYMEGHHLIPLTQSNVDYFWNNLGINIDCPQNIVSLCPNCHKAIHLGNVNIKKELIKDLYNIKIKDLNDIGISITVEELYNFYNMYE